MPSREKKGYEDKSSLILDTSEYNSQNNKSLLNATTVYSGRNHNMRSNGLKIIFLGRENNYSFDLDTVGKNNKV